MSGIAWVFLGVGLVVLALGVVAAVMAMRTRGKMDVMKATRTLPARDVAQIAEPTGKITVELYGVAETSQPLVSPVSQTPCVYYEHKIEQRHIYYDKYGSHESWQTLSDQKHQAPFWLRDSSGVIAVLPEDAEFKANHTVENQPLYIQEGSTGSFLSDVVDELLNPTSDEPCRQSEWAIPVGLPVYVLGNAYATGKGPCVQKGEAPFIVSVESEEELSHSFKWRFVGWLIAAVVLSAGGIVSIIYGVSRRAG